MPIELDATQWPEAIGSLKRYFAEEFETELSDLKARLFLEYILKEIGPIAYNAAIKDADAFLHRSLEDLSATCFEAPFTFWSRQRRPR